MYRRIKGTGGNPLRREADRTRTRMHAAFALTCLLAVIMRRRPRAGRLDGRPPRGRGHRAPPAHRDGDHGRRDHLPSR